MGVVDDVRKVIQDVVTPDFRALETRVDALDQKLDVHVKALHEKIDLSTKTLNEKIDSNARTLNEKIDSNARTLNEKIDSNAKSFSQELALTRERMIAEMKALHLESEMRIAKQIESYELDKRVTRIEAERAMEKVLQLDKTA